MFDYIDTIRNNYNKLAFITNKDLIKNIHDAIDYKYINLNICLTEKLLNYPIKREGVKWDT